MTTEVTQHRFDAAILGKEVRGQRVMLKLDWKLPGSKYDFTLYVDPDDADNLNVGDRLNWSITRGNLKDGKDAKYPTSFFWDWNQDEISEPDISQQDIDELFAPEDEDVGVKPDNPEQNTPPTHREPVDDTDTRIRKGACFNKAVDIYNAERDISAPIDYDRIWEIMSLLYYKVSQVGVHGYCRVHETGFRRNDKQGLYHKLGENWCVGGTVRDASGKVVEE